MDSAILVHRITSGFGLAAHKNITQVTLPSSQTANEHRRVKIPDESCCFWLRNEYSEEENFHTIIRRILKLIKIHLESWCKLKFRFGFLCAEKYTKHEEKCKLAEFWVSNFSTFYNAKSA